MFIGLKIARIAAVRALLSVESRYNSAEIAEIAVFKDLREAEKCVALRIGYL
jgi:hypothetical protein